MFLLYCNETPKGVSFNKNKLKLNHTPVVKIGFRKEIFFEFIEILAKFPEFHS